MGHFNVPQVPLQINGLIPIWLRKQVCARGRVVHILPQIEQGNLTLCDAIVGETTVGAVGDVVGYVAVGAEATNEEMDCAGA